MEEYEKSVIDKITEPLFACFKSTTSQRTHLFSAKCEQRISRLLYLDKGYPLSEVLTEKVFIPV